MSVAERLRGRGAHRLESVGGIEDAVEFIVRGGRWMCKFCTDRDVVHDDGVLLSVGAGMPIRSIAGLTGHLNASVSAAAWASRAPAIRLPIRLHLGDTRVAFLAEGDPLFEARDLQFDGAGVRGGGKGILLGLEFLPEHRGLNRICGGHDVFLSRRWFDTCAVDCEAYRRFKWLGFGGERLNARQSAQMRQRPARMSFDVGVWALPHVRQVMTRVVIPPRSFESLRRRH
jgi:hypothetical protein